MQRLFVWDSLGWSADVAEEGALMGLPSIRGAHRRSGTLWSKALIASDCAAGPRGAGFTLQLSESFNEYNGSPRLNFAHKTLKRLK
jgi:hypothetical protein